MSNITVRMVDGRTVTGHTCLMDQRGYARWARQHDELGISDDPSTFSLWMAFQFYKRQTGDQVDFDTFCVQAEELAMDDDAADPTSTETPSTSP